MSLRYALLGQLVEEELSGYDLVQRFTHTVGRYVWSASQAAVYTELNRLEREGLVETASVGARGRKAYRVTEDGVSELRGWLRTAPVRRSNDELLLRVFMLGQLDPDEALGYLRDLEGTYRARLEEYLERDRTARWTDTASSRLSRIALRAGIAHEQAMADWAAQAQRELGGVTER